jgi:hypothetical protein
MNKESIGCMIFTIILLLTLAVAECYVIYSVAHLTYDNIQREIYQQNNGF